MANPIKVSIEIELLLFKDGVGHIAKSLSRGHITEDVAHRQRNKLAGIYADRIVQLIEERRAQTDG